MSINLAQLFAFHYWAVIAACAAVVMLVSIIADRQRQRRALLDKVGFMPWTGISVMATLVTLISIALEIKG